MNTRTGVQTVVVVVVDYGAINEGCFVHTSIEYLWYLVLYSGTTAVLLCRIYEHEL